MPSYQITNAMREQTHLLNLQRYRAHHRGPINGFGIRRLRRGMGDGQFVVNPLTGTPDEVDNPLTGTRMQVSGTPSAHIVVSPTNAYYVPNDPFGGDPAAAAAYAAQQQEIIKEQAAAGQEASVVAQAQAAQQAALDAQAAADKQAQLNRAQAANDAANAEALEADAANAALPAPMPASAGLTPYAGSPTTVAAAQAAAAPASTSWFSGSTTILGYDVSNETLAIAGAVALVAAYFYFSSNKKRR